MRYLYLYYNEDAQKVRCRFKKETGAIDGFELAGTITEVERDLLIEILFERYGDGHISFKNFLRNYGELKTFCHKMKMILE